jgi:hypothetical protein
VLLVLFGFLFLLGRRKGWFAKKPSGQRSSYAAPAEKIALASRSDGYKGLSRSDGGPHELNGEYGGRTELHGEARMYESSGQEVHQLYGDEGKGYGIQR